MHLHAKANMKLALFLPTLLMPVYSLPRTNIKPTSLLNFRKNNNILARLFIKTYWTKVKCQDEAKYWNFIKQNYI